MTGPEFTSHNIVLPGGVETAPGLPVLAGTSLCQAILRDLWALIDFVVDPPTVADLGCLEGGYTAALAGAGFTAEGVEADEDNFACCLYVQDALRIPRLSFAHADVREYVDGRQWDAVLCSGLLYHLDKPVAFLRQLGEATGRVLVLNTHYAGFAGDQNEGYPGRWVPEPVTRWSSNGNTDSFWLTKQALVHCLREEAGFPTVFEQLDHMQDGAVYVDHHGNAYDSRCVLVAVK